MTKPKRLTIGMRCRIKTLKEQPSRNGKDGFYSNEDSWRREYGGRQVFLKERSSNGDFSFMLIGKKFEKERFLPKKMTGVVENEMAWISEDDLVFMNADFDANLDFVDWYQVHEDEFCGDCGTWFPKRGLTNPKTGKDYRCPNKKCPGARWDNGECPHCGTELTGKYKDYCRDCKEHLEQQL
jgi:hypothetical protein